MHIVLHVAEPPGRQFRVFLHCALLDDSSLRERWIDGLCSVVCCPAICVKRRRLLTSLIHGVLTAFIEPDQCGVDERSARLFISFQLVLLRGCLDVYLLERGREDLPVVHLVQFLRLFQVERVSAVRSFALLGFPVAVRLRTSLLIVKSNVSLLRRNFIMVQDFMHAFDLGLDLVMGRASLPC